MTPHQNYASIFAQHDGEFCAICHAGGEHPEDPQEIE